LRGTGRALLPVAEHPRPPCKTLRYASNPSLRVLALKDLLPCALRQVAVVSFPLPTCGDSRPELHGLTTMVRQVRAETAGSAAGMSQCSGMSPEPKCADADREPSRECLRPCGNRGPSN
jgi:hypothetical protein